MVAFYLPGNIPVYIYSVFLAFGATIGLAWIAVRSDQKQALRQMEAGMWVLLGSLIGSRVAYVAADWLYYREHFVEGVQIYLGGLAWPGALAGGLAALAGFTAIHHISLARLADDLLPLAAAVSVSAWLGCWVTGCAYGAASYAWGSLPSPDEWGVVANRWPIQVWGALLTVSLFALIEGLPAASRLKPGMRSLLSLLGMSLILLGMTFLRADPGYVWNGIRLEAWAALVYSLLALVGLAGSSFVRIKQFRRSPDLKGVTR